ncbi:PilC family type IV pilus tip adhesin, partial [Neisseria meningitidis]|uniref:PilC family type IV pilus tip adhesin n=1 Tax=Neisseria meningitidis TaxID=487 RepID=UPI001F0C1846
VFPPRGGGGAQAETHNYAIVMNEQNQLKVKQEGSYSTLREKDRERKFIYNKGRQGGGSVFFDNTDTLVSRQSGTAVFGTATYLPPYGKVSGFDADALKKRNNAVDWIRTTRIALAGYSYANVICRSSTGCPQLVYKTRFSFGHSGLSKKKTDGRLDIYEDKSRDGSPIYKLKDYPWLGVSFNLGSKNTVKNSQSSSSLISSFSEDNNNQTIVSTTESHPISLGDGQREHTAVVYYLNAKLHLLDKKQIQNITDKTVQLGVLKPSIDVRQQRGANWLSFWARWDIKDTGQIPVKLGLTQVKAGRCINANNPNKSTKAPSPALTAPALWFGPVQNGKAEMYSASVSTYPDSSSSRIFLQNLKRKTDPNKPGRYSLADLTKSDIESRQPGFTGRQTVIRLDGGVQQIKLGRNNDEVVNFNGNNGNNATFGIVKDLGVDPDANEWKKVLLPWTVRASNDDGQFNTFNKEENNGKPKYSQKYRSRDSSKHERNLGDIVNSPIVAVGGYLATSANDGMVHIFKKGNGVDERNYSLKLSYIPGTMPRKDIQSQDSTLAKELRAFAEKGYVGDRYGVDGGFVLREVELSGKKHVFMFGAMGFGGRGAYALDLTKAENGNPTAVSLFDVKHDNNGKNSNNSVQLGYTVGTPQIGKTHDGKYAAFLASGYATKQIDSGENTTALYVYDLESNNGTPIAKIEVPNGKGGLSSPTLVDKDLDGIVDIAYAGDRGGNMYRFDLSNNDPTKWSVRTIFKGTPDKPITSAPAVSKLKDKRVVIFGTGSDLSEEDVLSTDEQHIYGIFDNDTNTGTAQDGQGNGLLEQVLSEENKTLFLTDYKRSDG